MTYCDNWLDSQYAPVVEAFHASGLPALMCVFRNQNRWDTSNVQFENGVIRRYSKKSLRPECITLIGAWHVRRERGGGVADG